MQARTIFLSIVLAVVGCQTPKKSPMYLIRLQNGDTLAQIADKYDTTWEEIVALNDLSAGNGLKVGQVLRVAPGPGGRVVGAKRVPRHVAKRNLLAALDRPLGSPSRGLFFGSERRVVWPLKGQVTSHFGRRWGRMHEGVDIRSRRHTPISAAATGRVTFVGRKSGYGKTVIVNHDGFETLYAHCQKIFVNRGDHVMQGERVGSVGSTGRATGPHLHFEIRRKGRPFNPIAWLGSQPAS